MTTPPILNIAAYKFVSVPDPESLRQLYRPFCREIGLRGTILLSPEGINLMLAGTVEQIDKLRALLHQNPLFTDLTYKESYSESVPFTRMLVKIKPQIVSLGEAGRYNPLSLTADNLPVSTFKQWLDAGREDFVILDTRNDYEVRLGAFDGAIDLNIDHFREFPAAVDAQLAEMKDKTIVMYCTGGIRCEKASADLLEKGFKSVYQLQGGILEYFKQCGGAHYHGDCFVFDYRVALNPALEETNTVVCYQCQNPLDEIEQASPDYIVGVSCPYCRDRLAGAKGAQGDVSADAFRDVV